MRGCFHAERVAAGGRVPPKGTRRDAGPVRERHLTRPEHSCEWPGQPTARSTRQARSVTQGLGRPGRSMAMIILPA